MLELKTLFVGLICSLGVFALKAGAGLAYVPAASGPRWMKPVMVIVVVAAYATVFLGAWLVGNAVDAVQQFNRLRLFFQSAMAIHVAVAAGMLAWAFLLLRDSPAQGNESSPSTKGWLLFVFPCPVCAASVFVTCCLILSIFPDRAAAMAVASFVVFATLVLVSLLASRLACRLFRCAADEFLGVSMAFVGLYFLLTILIVPHVSELERVYRLAAYSSSQSHTSLWEICLLGAICLACGAIGFLSRWAGHVSR